LRSTKHQAQRFTVSAAAHPTTGRRKSAASNAKSMRSGGQLCRSQQDDGRVHRAVTGPDHSGRTGP
jgi:hypothetical protein